MSEMTPDEVAKWHRYMAQFRMHTTEGAENQERMADAVAALKQQKEDLEAALEFYADEDNYAMNEDSNAQKDCGDRARTALHRDPEGGG